MENPVIMLAVSSDNGCTLLEEMLIELVKDISLSSHHQYLLLTLLIDNS